MTLNLTADTLEREGLIAGKAGQEDIAALVDHTSDAEQLLAFYHRYKAPELTNLSVAENCLVYQDSLQEQVFDDIDLLPERNIFYSPPVGSPDLRERMAEFLGRSLGGQVNPGDLYGTAGVSSALECLALGLKGATDAGEPSPLRDGDGVLVPAPCWQGFAWSFQQRPKLVCVPIKLPTKGSERFKLTLGLVQTAYKEHVKDTGKPPRLLVLTNPHNPLGINYSKSLLEEIYAWVLNETEMHIISDEIYCHSQIAGAEPAFTSAVALKAYETEKNRKRIHVVWGFAKDFGLSGFRTGFIISSYGPVKRAMEGDGGVDKKRVSLSWFSPLDSLKSYVIEEILQTTVGRSSEPYTTYAMRRYGKRLTESFSHVKSRLDKNKIRYVHEKGSNAAQFFWLDLTEHLDGQGSADRPTDGLALSLSDVDRRELDLFQHIVNKAKVMLLPGGVMSCPTPGYFRLCYTALDRKKVGRAVDKVGKALKSWPPPTGEPGR